MLGLTRIIKNNLLNQNKLPEKWDDYNIGKVYDSKTNAVINIGASTNLNTKRSSDLYIVPEKLDATKDWDLKIKFSHTPNGYGSVYVAMFMLEFATCSIGPGSPGPRILPFGGKEFNPNTGSSWAERTIELHYYHKKGATKAYCECYCPNTGAKATIESNTISASTKLRPGLVTSGDYIAKYMKTRYLKDIKFTYDGKVLFKRA